MTSYKLHYFNARGRAEVARFILAHAGEQYEDLRIEFSDWKEKKNDMPYKQMPVLEIARPKGRALLPQSHAIERYLAKKFGLDGEDEVESAMADSVNEFLVETINKIPFSEKDEAKRDQMVKDTINGAVAEAFALLEGRVGECGYLVGKKLTYADLAFTVKADMVLKYNEKLLDATPKLKKLRNTVRALPGIAAWIEKRPETKF